MVRTATTLMTPVKETPAAAAREEPKREEETMRADNQETLASRVARKTEEVGGAEGHRAARQRFCGQVVQPKPR